MFADTQIPWNYLTLLRTHQTAVTLSIVLFLARGIGVQARASWPMWSTVRWASVLIDVVLLASGISLWILLAYNPLVHAWLGTKLLLQFWYACSGWWGLHWHVTQRGWWLMLT